MRIIALIAGAVLAAMAVGPALADGYAAAAVEPPAPTAKEPASPYGRLFRTLFGDGLERNHGVAMLGWAEGSLIEANTNPGETLLPKGFGQSTLPQSFFSQSEGGNFNQLGLMLCKGDGCPPSAVFLPNRNVLSRVGPLPGPRGEQILVDWNATLIFGEDAFFLKTKGFDDWGWDADRSAKLALAQWYLDIYLPLLDGTSLLLGSFQTPLEHDIGYPFTPPNWFASKTYAFAHGPAKHVGALAQSKLPISPEYGLLSVEGGVVTGWNRLGLQNNDPHFLVGTRWRSPNGKTAIDFEGIYGNGEGDFSDAELVDGIARPRGGGSPYLALSSNDAYLDRVALYLTMSHQFSPRLHGALEATYGRQEGGDIGFALGGPVPPFAITESSPWYGVNAALRLMLLQNLHFNLRSEWFRDENGAHVLWGSVGAAGGDVYSMTANLSWDPWTWLNIRPELRYDVYRGSGHLFAPVPGPAPGSAVATKDEQLIGILNAVKKF